MNSRRWAPFRSRAICWNSTPMDWRSAWPAATWSCSRLELAVAAARQAGIQRFVLVSAFPESFRGKQVSETFEHYMAVKKLADVHLAESDLDWVILRPGTLLDAPGTGKVRTGLAIPYGDVPREDVAATLLEIIEQPAVSRIIIELTEGDTPVAESVARLVHA